jgi:hypothetical protein
MRHACTLRPVVASPTNSVRGELERLGATFQKGRRGYISLTDYGQSIGLAGPTDEEPRRRWRGQSSEALELLSALPNDAGVEAVWRVLA